MPRPTARLLTLTAALVLGIAAPAAAEDRLIVRFDPDATASERSEARRDADAQAVRALAQPGAQVVEAADAADALRVLRRDPDVLGAEVDHRVRVAAAVPNDPGFGSLWGLRNTGQLVNGRLGVAGQDIGVLAAWDRTRGAGVTVAVLDTGTDLTVPDLAANAWANPGEVAANGLDDDLNGRVDDVHGWDYVNGDASPADDHGHGTHVAGTIAATANDGRGIAGVAPEARLLTVKVLDAAGSGYISDIADGFEYAAREGASVVNASLGGGGTSTYLKSAIARHPATVLVAAAGNDAADVDLTPTYPCAYALDNVVCVAASANTGGLASTFSNYGATRVHLAAPGRDVLSYARGGGSAWMSGTSMATPHVAGAAVLAKAVAPATSPAQLRAALVSTARPVSSLAGTTVAGGTLDAASLVTTLSPASTPPPPPPPPEPEPEPDPTPAPAPEPAPAPQPAPVHLEPALAPAPTPEPAPAPAPARAPAPVVQPAPARAPRPAPVVVRKVRREPPRHVRVTGGARARVTVRVCRGTACATTKATPRRGTWSARVRLPVATRRGTLTVRAWTLASRSAAATTRVR